jgi:hypothetical protein
MIATSGTAAEPCRAEPIGTRARSVDESLGPLAPSRIPWGIVLDVGVSLPFVMPPSALVQPTPSALSARELV